jgi:hypothetical protein
MAYEAMALFLSPHHLSFRLLGHGNLSSHVGSQAQFDSRALDQPLFPPFWCLYEHRPCLGDSFGFGFLSCELGLCGSGGWDFDCARFRVLRLGVPFCGVWDDRWRVLLALILLCGSWVLALMR